MSTLPFLTLIPAGAGSGKTYKIKEQLADWVASGQVQPDRIAAVTFTETAASELRERIRNTLMLRGRLEDALQLDRSFISTIHGFGRRLLVEYAFDTGSCPAPRLLAEDEEQLLLRKAIARIDRIEPLSRRLHLFGYRYDFFSGSTDVEQFRQRILQAIHRLRIIGGDVNRPLRLKHCIEHIRQTYGPTDDPGTLAAALRHSVQQLLNKYPGCMRDFVNSAGAKEAVENDCRRLQRAGRTDALNEDWELWKYLQQLKVFVKDDQLPADYQIMAREIKEHAMELYRHPGPLEDAFMHGEVLLESAWDALAEYAQRKREKGIIDYTDMIDGARLLLEKPSVLKHIAGRFDCLVIDEFQDTNPLQFSFLWRLHKAGVPALIVGDLKQSIMGFQSADPRLMQNLIGQCTEQCAPLTSNWRSQAELMEVINTIGGRMFGHNYASLNPEAQYKSRLRPLEAICFEGTRPTHKVKAQHIAARVKALLADDTVKVFDRHQNKHRSIRGEDIAILGLSHSRLSNYAEALRELGIRTRLAQAGWFECRPIQLAYYGLSYVADPLDRHAAFYLAVTELGQDDLTSATQTLLQADELDFPLLHRLKVIAQKQSDKTVDELVAETIDAMGLFDIVATWTTANQDRANLLRLIAESRNFVSADREALAGGGFHGSGLKTFLSWLVSQLQRKDGDRQPEAQVHDEEAVQLQTWHAAKGKEWPVVVVTTFDRHVRGRVPSLNIEYTDFSDLENVLENARMEFSPSFAAPETNAYFLERLNEKARAESINLLYVALTRAREQLILEWPSYLKPDGPTTYWHVLRDAAKMNLEGNKLIVGEKTFPCRVTAADREPPAAFDTPVTATTPDLPQFGRRALKSGKLPENPTPVFVTPSQLHGQPTGDHPYTIRTLTYASPLKLNFAGGTERGLLIHRGLELLCQGVSPKKTRMVLAELNPNDEDWEKIQNMASAFQRTLQKTFQPRNLHWEVPFTAGNADKSVVAGTIDLLLETTEGYWIVDHKSDEPLKLEETLIHYLPQLSCYANAMSDGLGLRVKGVAIHWACMGKISKAVI